MGDALSLHGRIGGAQIDEHRGKPHQREHHGDKTVVARAQEPSQQDRRAHLHDHIQTACGDKRDAAMQGFAAKSGVRLVLVEIIVDFAFQQQTLIFLGCFSKFSPR